MPEPQQHASGFWFDPPDGFTVHEVGPDKVELEPPDGPPRVSIEFRRLDPPVQFAPENVPGVIAQTLDGQYRPPAYRRKGAWHRPTSRGVGVRVDYERPNTPTAVSIFAVVHPGRLALIGYEHSRNDPRHEGVVKNLVSSFREHRDPRAAEDDARARAREHRLTTFGSRRQHDEYQAFLCHNSLDKPDVRRIRDHLQNEGIVTWMDENQIAPGDGFVPEIEKALGEMDAFVIAFGPNGIGDWQELERGVALNVHVDRRRNGGRPVLIIPVSLPGGPAPEQWPLFVRNFHGVDMRDGLQNRLAELALRILRDPGYDA